MQNPSSPSAGSAARHPHDAFAAATRPALLERLGRDHYDVVVVGGGITGVGTALDAVTRGLRVALVERDDLASGTSSKSSKLVHGGLRYLQNKDFALVYEALAERQRLLRLAPHLVRELDFVLPVYGRKAFKRTVAAGLWLYDLTGGFRIGKLHKPISADRTVAEFPALTGDKLLGGFFYPDAQTDDARLTMYVARTAALHGADVATYTTVEGLEKDASGRVVGVACRDTLGGTTFSVRGTVVINAAGVWSDAVRRYDEGTDPQSIRPAKGVHVVVPRALVPTDRAFILPSVRDKRSVFVLPWGPVAWIGTTDTDYDGPVDDPQATPDDIAYLLDAVNHWIREPIDDTDIISTWAGLRPLVSGATVETESKTTDLSRRHSVIPGSPGFVTVTGGKLTTYRVMARDAVEWAVEHGPLSAGRSVTHRTPIDGAAGFDPMRRFGLEPDVEASLLRRHGANADAVIGLVRHDPALGERLVPELPYLRAEVVHAVRHESAGTVEDVLERRIRLSLEHRSRGLDALDDVCDLLGAELGWTAERADAERAAYRARVDDTLAAEKVTTLQPATGPATRRSAN